MKKILLSIDSLYGGGAEKVLIDILDKIGNQFKVDLLLIHETGVYLNSVNPASIIMSIYGKKFQKIRALFNKVTPIRKLITLYVLATSKFYIDRACVFKNMRNRHYDVEVAFLEGPASTLIARHNSNAKKIAWIHTDLEKHRTMSIEKEREVYNEFDAIVCVSEASRHSFEKLYPEHKSKVKVIYNPVDIEKIKAKSKEGTSGFDCNKITLVSVGRLTAVKGYDLLLQAHKELLAEGLDYNLVIIGDGEKRSEFERYINENGINNNTRLLGFIANPYPYIAAADIFVLPSRYEGFSLVVSEALVLGKPVISTNCTGPVEILDNGKYGLIIDSESVIALKESIRTMVLNHDLREKYAALAKQRSTLFDIDKVMGEIITLFSGA